MGVAGCARARCPCGRCLSLNLSLSTTEARRERTGTAMVAGWQRNRPTDEIVVFAVIPIEELDLEVLNLFEMVLRVGPTPRIPQTTDAPRTPNGTRCTWILNSFVKSGLFVSMIVSVFPHSTQDPPRRMYSLA